ncbi:hypothetical protein [Thermococcus eurythermalis]|nr:hypothetical protein [Thermococcus eurythermalis]
MRDFLPRGYSKIKFSRFVELKAGQVAKLRRLALELLPSTLSSGGPDEEFEVPPSTVGDYANVLREAIVLEKTQLQMAKRFAECVQNWEIWAILEDFLDEVQENISFLQKELERVENFNRKARFSEFIQELVGDRDGRV